MNAFSSMFLLNLIQKKKCAEKGLKQGLLRSIADFGSPLCDFVIRRRLLSCVQNAYGYFHVCHLLNLDAGELHERMLPFAEYKFYKTISSIFLKRHNMSMKLIILQIAI